VGLNHCPTGLLADVEMRQHVRPIEVHTYDSMHTWLANGVAQTEIYLFMQALKQKLGLGHAHLQSLLNATWVWPKIYATWGRQAGDIFNEVRCGGSQDSFRASASEVLMVYPVLLHLAEDTLGGDPRIAAERRSFIAMCKVLVTLENLKKGMQGSPEQLAAGIQDHMQAFLLAYSLEAVKPKHHFQVHVPGQIARDGQVLDTFTLERKHKITKACAQHVLLTTSFEKSVLARVLQVQLRELEDPDWPKVASLQGRTAPMPALGVGTIGSLSAILPSGLSVSSGDVVFIEDERRLVLVAGFLSQGPKLYLMADPMQPLRKVSSRAWECRIFRQLDEIDCALHRICETSCWTYQDGGQVLVLL
jgi:hypothetical protein